MTKKDSDITTMGISTLAGFLGTGYIGNLSEDRFAPDVTKDSNTNDKLKAIVANDTLKVLSFLTLRGMEKKTSITNGLMIGSGLNFIVDMYLRYQNSWAPGDKNLFGFPVLSCNQQDQYQQQTQQTQQTWAPLSEQQLQEINRKINSNECGGIYQENDNSNNNLNNNSNNNLNNNSNIQSNSTLQKLAITNKKCFVVGGSSYCVSYAGGTDDCVIGQPCTPTQNCTGISLTANPISGTIGTTINLTATTTPAVSGFNVFFKDGSTTLGTIATNSSGVATYAWVTTGQTVGSHSLTAGVTGQCTSSTISVNLTTGTSGITVTAPTSGSNWQKGSQYNITWTSSGVTGNVVIHLFKGGAWKCTIIGMANTGSYSWTVPTTTCQSYTVVAGTDYTIKIEQQSNTSIYGISPQFTISVSTQNCTGISLTANPISGTIGTTINLTATTTPAVSGFNVFFKDGSTTLGTIATNSSGVATYAWVTTGQTVGSHSLTAGVTGQCTSSTISVNLTASTPDGIDCQTTGTSYTTSLNYEAGTQNWPVQRMNNNKWSNPNANQHVWCYTGGVFGWDWNMSGSMKTPNYPEIYVGRHVLNNSGSTTPIFPKKWNEITSWTSNVKYEYLIKPSQAWYHELGYDIYIIDPNRNDVGSCSAFGRKKSNFMIWVVGSLGYYKNDMTDGINTYTYHMKPCGNGPETWNWHGFILKDQTNYYPNGNFKCDIKKLIDYVRQKDADLGKPWNTNWQINCVEFGTEYWGGSGKVKVTKFVNTVNGQVVKTC